MMGENWPLVRKHKGSVGDLRQERLCNRVCTRTYIIVLYEYNSTYIYIYTQTRIYDKMTLFYDSIRN